MSDRVRRVGVEPCEIDGCDKPMRARGWCTAHWTRWRRHGSPTGRIRGEVVDGRRICPRCKQDIPLDEWYRRPDGVYLSCLECQRAYLRKKANARYVPKPKWEAVCEVCGAAFMADKRQYLTCSPDCKATGINRRNWKHVQKRRALIRAVESEQFDAREIFERDGWTCGLCGDPINKAERPPHPNSPSVDHIVPLALGGAHTRANVQAAHLGCNVRKGARLVEAVS